MLAEEAVTIERRGDWIVARWHGDVDMANARLVEEQSLRPVLNTDTGVVVDLTDVAYVDSAGLRALVAMRRLLAEHQQVLRILLPEGSLLEKAIVVGGIGAIIPLHRSLETALTTA